MHRSKKRSPDDFGTNESIYSGRPALRSGQRRHPQKAKGRSQTCAVRNTLSINNASMPDLRNVTMASVGAQTIGSLSLKDVLTTSGTPVFAKKRDMRS